MVSWFLRLASVFRTFAALAATHAGLLCCQSDLHAQAAYYCSSPIDCAAGANSCPGCDAFFKSAPSSVPFESAVPTDPDTTLPDVVDPLYPTPSLDDLAGEGVGEFPADGDLSTGSFASTLGAVSGGRGVPSMIGDFFGSGFNYVQFPGAGGTNGPSAADGDRATVAVAGGDRRFKSSENNSPFPRDRVFFNYHHFNNAVIDGNGRSRNLDRYTFGLEKTFCDGLASFEVRTPFARTVTSSPSVFDNQKLNETEFGNTTLVVKGLLHQEARFAASVGLGIVLPTGDDFIVESSVPNRFENGAVNLQPFLGIYHAPTPRLFTQFFTQLDFDAGNSEVLIGGQVDELRMQTLLMLDYSVGYWLMTNRRAKHIRAVAPMLELHYTTTLEDQDYGIFKGQGIFIEDFRRDVLNITGGLFMQIGTWSSLKIGAVAPLRTGSDKLFDSEIGLQYVHNF